MKTEMEEMGCEEHRCLIEDMEATLERVKLPKLGSNCCIYRVPQIIRKGNPEAYTPKVVSIGPLHHGDENLKPMEELKLGYLKFYLERTEMKLKDCITKLKEKEEFIRSCYAETISQNSDDFIKMILIDACFIIEYLLRMGEKGPRDSLLSIPNLAGQVLLDLILLENQLPFSVLEDMFCLTYFDGECSSFLEMGTHFTSGIVGSISNAKIDIFPIDNFREDHLKKRLPDGECEEVKVLHFTDLLRICHLPRRDSQPRREKGPLRNLYSASQLAEAGVKFKVRDTYKSLTELEFEGGVLTIPQLHIYGLSQIVLRNMAALEQCHFPYDTYIGEYLHLLSLLINDRRDVDILTDERIMITSTGDDNTVAAMFKNISKGLVDLSCNADYLQLAEDLNGFYEKPLHKYKAIFFRDYLSTPWKIASIVAATVLLLLTLIQTIFSIISKP